MEESSSSWSSRRKFFYTLGIVVILASISFAIFWKFWYRAPSCTDRLKNGDETGVDCGGKCSLVCADEALKPVLQGDPRILQVSPGVYSAVAFLENHNISFSAPQVNYKFTFYNKDGKVMYERLGSTVLPKNKVAAIFEGNINIATSTPARVSFELDKNIVWVKDAEPEPEIKIKHTPLLNQDKLPRIESTVENDSLLEVRNLEIVAVILDGKDNVVAASRTFVDRLKKGETTNVFFTWPSPFALGESACEKSSATMLVIDRSGSIIASLPDIKKAATDFVLNLKARDMVGVVSFASSATVPVDAAITSDFDGVLAAIDRILVSTSTADRDTNIADGVNKASENLSRISDKEVNKVMVLLTDGNPTVPKLANVPKQPFIEAESAISAAKEKNINIYTIGLGKELDQDFLKSLASSPESYFAAPSATDLKKIYNNISSAICEEIPARIELFVKKL